MDIENGMTVMYKRAQRNCLPRHVIGILDGWVFMRIGNNPYSCDSYPVEEFWERYRLAKEGE